MVSLQSTNGFAAKAKKLLYDESLMEDLDSMPLIKRRRILLSRPPQTCPVDIGVKRVKVGALQDWPGLPRGVKFDPSDEDLLWHLLGKIGRGEAEPHPFINEFIVTVDEDELGHAHPQKLPGVKQDGSVSYLFHRTFKGYNAGTGKCQEMNNDDLGNACWHKIGKTKPVIVGGIHKGCKKIMALYMRIRRGEKPEKTNWVMHQYHLGMGEDEEGEFVVSKVFYQQRTKLLDVEGLPKETVGAAVTNEKHLVSPRSMTQELHAEKQHPDGIYGQVAVDHEIRNEDNSACLGLKKHDDRDKPKDHLHAEGVFICDELLQSQSSGGCDEAKESRSCLSYCTQIGVEDLKKKLEGFNDVSVSDYNSKCALSSEQNYAGIVTEVRAAQDQMISNEINSDPVRPCLIYATDSEEFKGHADGKEGINISTNDLLQQLIMFNHDTEVKVEQSEYSSMSPCREGTISLSHADSGFPTVLSKSEIDEDDHIPLHERRKMLLSSIHSGFGNFDGSRCYTRMLGSYNSIRAEDNWIIPERERDETLMCHLEAKSSNNTFGLMQDPSAGFSSVLMNNVNEFIAGRLQTEKYPSGTQFPLECYVDSATEKDAANSTGTSMLDFPDSLIAGTPTVNQSLPRALNCQNKFLFGASSSQEDQESVNIFSSQTSVPEVKSPSTGGDNSESHCPTLTTFLFQVKAEPLEEGYINGDAETNAALPNSTAKLGFPDKGVAGSSCTITQSLSEAGSCLDNLSSKHRKSPGNQESNQKCSYHASISEVKLSSFVEELTNMNANSELVFPIKVKAEPLEESYTKSVSEANTAEPMSTSRSGCPDSAIVDSFCTVTQCSSKAKMCQDDFLSSVSYSQENEANTCICSNRASLPEEVHTKLLSNLVSGSPNNDFSMSPCIVTECSSSTGKNVLSSDSKLPENQETDCICSNQASHPEVHLNANSNLPSLAISSCPVKVKAEHLENGLLRPCKNPLVSFPDFDMLRAEVKREFLDELSIDVIDHIPLKKRIKMLVSSRISDLCNGSSLKRSKQTALRTSEHNSIDSVKAKASGFSLRRKRKKTATDSVETALEEDAPGLLQVLMEKGITVEEIKLYGDKEDDDLIEISSTEERFEELEAVMTKLFSERPSLLKFPPLRHIKGSKAVYCLACLISLIEQTRYLRFRNSPVEWGWCRDLQSFIFVFENHNRLVLERPEYGYATYFFELVESLPIDWQIKRLVTAMKLTSCGRTTLIENKSLLVGEDLTEGEASVLESYGWTPNTGLGSMLNYCDRVVHDKKNENYSSEWRNKIGKLLMNGHDRGRIVLDNLPLKAAKYTRNQGPEIKLEF